MGKVPDDFYIAYKDRAVCHLNGATSNYQCVCGFKEFLWWCGAGYPQSSHASVGGNADQLRPGGLQSQYAKHFQWINSGRLQDGDWVILPYDGTGHVAMYYNGMYFGQNQGRSGVTRGAQGGQKFTLAPTSNWGAPYGAWRWSQWISGVPASKYSSIGDPSKTITIGNNFSVLGSDPTAASTTPTVSINVDYTKLTPNLLTINRKSTARIEWKKVKDNKIVGCMVEGGYLYDSAHREMSRFRNPQIESQITALVDQQLPYALYMIARAKTVDEAKKEMYEFSFLIRKYPPGLGVWLKLELPNSISQNDKIVDQYYKDLVNLGLKDKVGFYCTESKLLSQITWKRYRDKWFFWLDKHVSKISELDKLLDPTFFDVKE